MQKKNFDFIDIDYDEMMLKYDKSKTMCDWWCNKYTMRDERYHTSQFNINYKHYLKEYMLENPPEFKISNKCCDYAKKQTIHKFETDNHIQLDIIGVRKAEGGQRSLSIKSCFTDSVDAVSQYRPIFWYSNKDKESYENYFDISHSKCYTEYGMKRTGCVGCPFSLHLEEDLETMQKYEPNLYKAAIHVFGKSYEYTRKYKEFRKMMKAKAKNKQKKLFEIEN